MKKRPTARTRGGKDTSTPTPKRPVRILTASRRSKSDPSIFPNENEDVAGKENTYYNVDSADPSVVTKEQKPQEK